MAKNPGGPLPPEDSFREIIGQNSLGMAYTDAEGRIMYANHRFHALLAYNEGDLKGTFLSDLAGEDDREENIRIMRQTIAEGLPFELEQRLKTKDANEVWARIQVSPIRDHSGNSHLASIILTDVSDTRVTADTLRRSEERMLATMESAIDFAIIITDVLGKITAWSAGAEKNFGYTETEVMGRDASIIFTEEDIAADVPEKEMQQARREGRAMDERWHRRKDESRLFVSGVMSPIMNGSVLLGYVKVARDITERKVAEEALKLSEERYRTALQSAEMGAWDLNLQSGKLIWNDQHHALFGIQVPQEAEAVHDLRSFMERIHPEDAPKVERNLSEAIRDESVFQAEFRIIREDNGEMRWMTGYGRLAGGSQERRIVGVMYDITPRKILEQQKDEFISVASHELKTPVTSIKTYAEILKETFDPATDAESATLVDKLNMQVDRLTVLVHGLLDIARLSEGAIRLDLEPLRLDVVLRKCIEDAMPLAANHSIVFEAQEDHRTVSADRGRMALVINNFLSNAIKYSPGGGEILVRLDYTNKDARVRIRDNGIGITREAQERVFERFFREEGKATELYPGMGLGLYIAAQIIHHHHGTVDVNSEPGKGSEFTFTIPLATGQGS